MEPLRAHYRAVDGIKPEAVNVAIEDLLGRIESGSVGVCVCVASKTAGYSGW